MTLVMTLVMPTMIALVVVPAATVIAMSAVFVSMPRLVFRYIRIIIPLIAHKIDRPVAGIVFMTMLFPIFLVPRRNMDINRRRRRHTLMRVNDHNWSWI